MAVEKNVRAPYYSTLYLNKDMCAQGTLHPVWNTVRESPQDIIRACAKIRLLTGQYRLKVDIAKQSGGPPTCQLCHRSNDDFYHLLLDWTVKPCEASDLIFKARLSQSYQAMNSVMRYLHQVC